LEYNNIQLQENEWDPAAYEQALRRAWARSHGIDAEHVYSEPEVFAFDVHPESPDDGATATDENPAPQPLPVPVPEPTPLPAATPKPADKPLPDPTTSQAPSAGQSPDPAEKHVIVPTSGQERFTEPNWLSPIVRQPPLVSEPGRVPSRRATKLPIAK
jgi:hypothetical protein